MYVGDAWELNQGLNFGDTVEALGHVRTYSFVSWRIVMNISKIQCPPEPDSEELEEFIDKMSQHMHNLQVINDDPELTRLGCLIVYFINMQMDPRFRAEWNEAYGPFGAVRKLLKTVYNLYEIQRRAERNEPWNGDARVTWYHEVMRGFDETRVLRKVEMLREPLPMEEVPCGSPVRCYLCHGPHGLYNCAKFLMMWIPERRKLVRELGLCVICLWKHCSTRSCSVNTFYCDHCGMPHSSRLHAKEGSRFYIWMHSFPPVQSREIPEYSGEPEIFYMEMVKDQGAESGEQNPPLRALVWPPHDRTTSTTASLTTSNYSFDKSVQRATFSWS